MCGHKLIASASATPQVHQIAFVSRGSSVDRQPKYAPDGLLRLILFDGAMVFANFSSTGRAFQLHGYSLFVAKALPPTRPFARARAAPAVFFCQITQSHHQAALALSSPVRAPARQRPLPARQALSATQARFGLLPGKGIRLPLGRCKQHSGNQGLSANRAT